MCVGVCINATNEIEKNFSLRNVMLSLTHRSQTHTHEMREMRHKSHNLSHHVDTFQSKKSQNVRINVLLGDLKVNEK